MKLSRIVAWVQSNFHLGDVRRAAALAEMAWGLIVGGKVSYAEIGRHMLGPAQEDSKITRVFNFCHNKHVEPGAVQRDLVRVLLAKTQPQDLGKERVITVSIDWHMFDNAEECSLRVSLLTGSRALPLLWYDVKKSDLKGRQKEIEYQALEDLISLRPEGIKWLVLLDSGFRSAPRIRALETVGYFILRSDSKTQVHASGLCWKRVEQLGVQAGQVVEFGYVRWSCQQPVEVRLVACKLLKLVQYLRRRKANPQKSKNTQPGLWPLLTNLPSEQFSAVAVVRLYARRFECEHNFRDMKNASLGLDMEHLHLKKPETYTRLMCIVALAELLLWLFGSEAEAKGTAKTLSPSRPKDGRRVLSLVRVGHYRASQAQGGLTTLIRAHLRPALQKVFTVVGRNWIEAIEPDMVLRNQVSHLSALPPLPRACTQHAHGKRPECVTGDPVLVARPAPSAQVSQIAA